MGLDRRPGPDVPAVVLHDGPDRVGVNDSFFATPQYDELFKLQQRATDEASGRRYIAEMQQIFYDEAAYHVLYYDSELHAYRTDKFGGWTNQPPDSGTPLFGYGYPVGYTLPDRRDTPHPSRGPVRGRGRSRRRPGGAGAGPVRRAATGSPTSGDTALLILGIVVARRGRRRRASSLVRRRAGADRARRSDRDAASLRR